MGFPIGIEILQDEVFIVPPEQVFIQLAEQGIGLEDFQYPADFLILPVQFPGGIAPSR